MKPDFWIKRWESNSIGFHQNQANKFLTEYVAALPLQPGQRVFLPLCGKTLDIGWLLSQGYSVAGIELSPLAIEQLFQQLAITPKIEKVGALLNYKATNLDIFSGNFFDLTDDILEPVDAIYDRAALIALPHEMRVKYSRHLAEITHQAPQLLMTLEYEEEDFKGPPFSVDTSEVHTHYESTYSLKELTSIHTADGLKGKFAATERVWLLEQKPGFKS